MARVSIPLTVIYIQQRRFLEVLGTAEFTFSFVPPQDRMENGTWFHHAEIEKGIYHSREGIYVSTIGVKGPR